METILQGVRIAVVGGDRRVEFYLPRLVRLGATIVAVGLRGLPGEMGIMHRSLNWAVRESEALILPMSGCDSQAMVSSTYDEPVDLAEPGIEKKGLLVLSGIVNSRLEGISRANGWQTVAIADDDELAILNSIPTAEGAVRLAQERAIVTIDSSRALVLGAGRCGVTLARLLVQMGANVGVVARRDKDLARVQTMGCTPITWSRLPAEIGTAQFVFNTIPALVLPHTLLIRTRQDVVVVDLASAPGGLDYAAADRLRRCVFLAPGIPGKYAPKTAGEILSRVLPRLIVQNLDKEE